MSTSPEKKPVNQDNNRNENGTFKKGFSGNLNGRPRGKSLKEFDREKFAKMPDEEKDQFLSKMSPEFRYRMAEGNPESEVRADITSAGEKIGELLPEHKKLIEEYEDKLKSLKT